MRLKKCSFVDIQYMCKYLSFIDLIRVAKKFHAIIIKAVTNYRDFDTKMRFALSFYTAYIELRLLSQLCYREIGDGKMEKPTETSPDPTH